MFYVPVVGGGGGLFYGDYDDLLKKLCESIFLKCFGIILSHRLANWPVPFFRFITGRFFFLPV